MYRSNNQRSRLDRQDLTFWYEFVGATSLATSRQRGPDITFTRASSGTYFDSSGVLQTASSNVARFDHDPSNNSPLGLLIEEARTNITLQSEDLDTTWTITRASTSVNAIVAPDGNTTADKLIDNTDNDTHAASQSIEFTDEVTYNFSSFAKKGEHTRMWLLAGTDAFPGTPGAVFNLDTGVVDQEFPNTDDSGIIDVGDGWFRCWFTATADASVSSLFVLYLDSGTGGSGVNSFIGNGADGAYFWGMQVEAGVFPTSYIKTTTGTVARAADVATITDMSWFDDNKGTFYIVGRSGPNISNELALQIDAGGSDNRFFILHLSGAGKIGLESKNGAGNDGAAYGDSTVAAYADFKFAGTYAQDDVSGATDGTLDSTPDTSADFPLNATITTLRIGTDHAGSNYWNGHLAEIKYWNVRKPDSFLESETA